MSKKLLLIATVQSHIAQFHKPLMRMLKENGWEIHVAARNNLAEKNGLQLEYPDKVFDVPFQRSPFDKRNIGAFKAIQKILAENHYDVIHCNTPVGGVVGRLAGNRYRKSGTQIYYTAHGFHFYKGAPLKNWLLYYPVEWVCAHWTDVLITINHEDYARAKEHMHAKRVEYVPGVGIDVKRFLSATVDRAAKRREIGVPEDATLLLSVGELNANKNHATVIRALAKVEDANIHYAIAGNGPLKQSLEDLAKTLGIGNQLHLLGYRRDIPELYKAAEICVFPSIREGQGLSALEGMASGLPLIASDNRGTRDILIQGKNALICRYSDVEGFAEAIREMASDPVKRETFGAKNRVAAQNYDVAKIQPQLANIYADWFQTSEGDTLSGRSS